MKKFLLLLVLIILSGTSVIAEDMPTLMNDLSPKSDVPSDNYKKANTNNLKTNIPKLEPTSAQSFKTSTFKTPAVGNSKLEQLTLELLKAAEERNQSRMDEIALKMMNAGATGYIPPTIYNKKTPQCPPIKIKVNGVVKSGSHCAISGYEYNGKTYQVDYCN